MYFLERLEVNAPNTISLEEIIKAFQLHFESGFAKVAALKAMDKKIKVGKISPQMRLGFGYGMKVHSSQTSSALPVEQETTFLINRPETMGPGPSSGPKPSGVVVNESVMEPEVPSVSGEAQPHARESSSISNTLEGLAYGSVATENADYDLEEKLNRILGDSYFR